MIPRTPLHPDFCIIGYNKVPFNSIGAFMDEVFDLKLADNLARKYFSQAITVQKQLFALFSKSSMAVLTHS